MTLKQLYKTVWEIKQRVLVDMAADRGAFIDQSQSFNVHMSDPNFGKLTSLHFYTWKKGLKTGARKPCLWQSLKLVLYYMHAHRALVSHHGYKHALALLIAAPPVISCSETDCVLSSGCGRALS